MGEQDEQFGTGEAVLTLSLIATIVGGLLLPSNVLLGALAVWLAGLFGGLSAPTEVRKHVR